MKKTIEEVLFKATEGVAKMGSISQPKLQVLASTFPISENAGEVKEALERYINTMKTTNSLQKAGQIRSRKAMLSIYSKILKRNIELEKANSMLRSALYDILEVENTIPASSAFVIAQNALEESALTTSA